MNESEIPLKLAREDSVQRDQEQSENDFERIVRIEKTIKVFKRYFAPNFTWTLIEELKEEGVF